ncbi:MAG: hypothetical protein QI199_06750 [Candidatus Korarchaeota archaeon]|nr:hypothetical protein [Candidatus Korarchaeota archaeon]
MQASKEKPGDLCLKPRGPSDAAEMVRLAARLGYGLLGIEADDEAWSQAQQACADHGLLCLRRTTIEASTASEARRELRGIGKHRGIVALRPLGTDAARFAGRDTRIRLLTGTEAMRYADRSQYRLIRVGGGAVEADLSIVARGDARYIIRLMRLCAAHGVPLVMSSCAPDKHGLWHPRSAAALATFAAMPLRIGLEAVYIAPWRVVG